MKSKKYIFLAILGVLTSSIGHIMHASEAANPANIIGIEAHIAEAYQIIENLLQSLTPAVIAQHKENLWNTFLKSIDFPSLPKSMEHQSPLITCYRLATLFYSALAAILLKNTVSYFADQDDDGDSHPSAIFLNTLTDLKKIAQKTMSSGKTLIKATKTVASALSDFSENHQYIAGMTKGGILSFGAYAWLKGGIRPAFNGMCAWPKNIASGANTLLRAGSQVASTTSNAIGSCLSGISSLYTGTASRISTWSQVAKEYLTDPSQARTHLSQGALKALRLYLPGKTAHWAYDFVWKNISPTSYDSIYKQEAPQQKPKKEDKTASDPSKPQQQKKSTTSKQKPKKEDEAVSATPKSQKQENATPAKPFSFEAAFQNIGKMSHYAAAILTSHWWDQLITGPILSTYAHYQPLEIIKNYSHASAAYAQATDLVQK